MSLFHELPPGPESPRLKEASPSSPWPQTPTPASFLGTPEFFVCAELRTWPSKDQLAALLRASGLHIQVGQYSIRIEGSSFVFQEFGGDLGRPQMESNAATLTEMTNDAQWLSEALTKVDLSHRIEVFLYAEEETRVAYFHHKWPPD